ncbi:peptidase metallopeptidase [Methylobacterium sp. BTF04]|uniref:Hint domain-containing protein n=1 Tax=Methylobacterium sp. BTF04 TaxID=2708300 RepID=UPI0013D5F652|nr:Hint domain-containing protein [Methylobacterium sp. BTF04]NEU12513.1 peptidase metallopeptidase [Methylobacterium sp. BTF04]
MENLNAAQLDELTFMTGIDEKGAIANDTYFTYYVEETRPGNAYISKWYNDASAHPLASTSKAGTPGGTVTYTFDAGLSAEARAAYSETLTLWSDIANISFKEETANPAAAGMKFSVATGSGGDTFVPANGARLAGAGVTDLPAQASPNGPFGRQAEIAIDPGSNTFNSFTPSNSWLTTAVTHELGHVIGLGHTGRYNGPSSEGQRGVYDSKLYSVMSYFDPADTSAGYYANYPVSGTNWTQFTSAGTDTGSPQTPMMMDILAIQRIYGASTSSTFAGGQTYGFNANITDASKSFYDFTVNKLPVVTLYNSGTNNTLDLSGYRTNSTINLNPGTFSSASASGQLVNNIGIAYGTRIDTAIGGAGNDIIFGNADNNRVDGGGGTNTFIITGASTNFTVLKVGALDTIVTDKTTGAVDTLTNIQAIEFQDPVCFTTGTRIGVIRDSRAVEVAVEGLRVGDVAVTAAGGRRSIRWIGHRRITPSEHAVPSRQWPIRILPGAFGTDPSGHAVPARDLRLSPGHPVLVGADADNEGGVLVPVMCLINGTSIARERVETVDYWHIELDGHDILLAEGLPAESFIECGTRAWFGEAAACSVLADPDFTPAELPGRCRPVAVEGPKVEAERRRLDSVFAAHLSAQADWPNGGDTIMSDFL